MSVGRRRGSDETRFIALFGDVSPDVLRYFERRVAEDAADLLAETMLVAWRRRSDLPAANVDARMWVFGVARNVLANAQRGERRRHALADRLRSQVSADRVADTSEALAIRELIDALDPDLAEVVTLAHWEGMSFAEIARLQGVPAATVRGRYRRAKIALATSLADSGTQ